MLKSEDIQNRLQNLFDSQKLATISTQRDGQPYASLVAFAGTDDLRHIFFVTPTATRKFSNLTSDARVAVLINSSTNAETDFHEAISVTATGTAREVNDLERKKVLDLYLAKHPYLEDFAHSPSCAVVRVTVKSYYLVQNFQNVTEFHIEK